MISSAIIQLIALLTMTIDHIGYYLLGDAIILRIIGRIAMPLFVLMLAEGYHYAPSKLKYLMRIVITAMVAQIPIICLYQKFGYHFYLNILFGFPLCLLMMYLLDKSWLALIFLPMLMILAVLMHIDYGAGLVFLATGFYLARRIFPQNAGLRKVFQSITLIVANVILVAVSGNRWQWLDLLALVPIWLYSGKKGRRLPKYFMYIYYPAHLMVLFLIKVALTSAQT